MAKPRRIFPLSQLTGGESAIARKVAIRSQLIGFRSSQSRYSVIATNTTMSTVRTMSLALGIRAVFALPGRAPVGGLVHEAARHRAGPEQPRPGVCREDRAELAHDRRAVAVDLRAALDQLAAQVRRVDVLRGPRVGARIGAPARVVEQALEHPLRGAHPLDGRHLVLHGEDGLHLQRRADPGARGADAAAAPEELERVDREPEPELLARLSDVFGDLLRVRAVAGGL